MASDRGEAVCATVRVDVQSQMGQVDRQPHVCGQGVDLPGQLEIADSDPLGGRGVLDQFAELVHAAAHVPVMEFLRYLQRRRSRCPRDVP
jgi:hypothetical protein